MVSELYGMSFGSYNSKITEAKEKYDVRTNDYSKKDEYESSYTFFNKGQGGREGNAFREKIKTDYYGNNKFSNAVIFEGDLMYGTMSDKQEGLDTFDYIQAGNEYAVDLNGNGTVDENEIFEGQLDRFSYQKAKNDGYLRKYTEYQKQYHYDWLYWWLLNFFI